MKQVRVRFAPSPTGYLHVGGLRTALYNYLFAKHHNGKFLLRIEDTDQTRYVEGAVENLLSTLKACGLEYDEGPDIDGGFGPYTQSERTDLYRKYSNELLAKGKAYNCFCTSERLDELRALQKLKNQAPGYDGRCRLLSNDQVAENIKNGIPYTVRLKVPKDSDVKFYDEIRGWVTYTSDNIDDQVLLKSDNFPTYHLANVVDDHLMEITHVIRGEEWLPSTPKHAILYDSFGWERPKFAHLPLLLNPDRTKLSKRQGDVAVEDYLNKGYVLQALLNFVALLGWNVGEGSEQEIFTKLELIEKFTLERVNKAGAVFDISKLKWMNGVYLRSMNKDDFFNFVKPVLIKSGIEILDEAKMKDICFTVRDNIELADDIIKETDVFFRDLAFENESATEIAKSANAKIIYHCVIKNLESIEILTDDLFKNLMKTVQTETALKGKDLWMPFRVGISGKEHGPDITKMSVLLGKSLIIRRLNSLI